MTVPAVQTQYQMVFLGRHNAFSVPLTYGGVPLSSPIVAVEFKYKTVFYSSERNPELFDLTQYPTTKKIFFDIHGLSMPVGKDESCEVIVYTEQYPDTGIVCEPQLYLEVSDEVLGDETLPDPIGYTWTPARLASKTVENDYQVELIDFLRPSVRINALVLKTMTMPVMPTSYNGARITFILKNVGDIDIVAATGEGTTFGDETATKITGTEKYSSVTLEYDADADMFIIVSGRMRWSGGMV